MEKILFTSESVTEGHPDKMCDAISDAILDALMAQDPMSRVACETAATTGLVLVMGEITTNAYVDIQKIVRETVREIGYDRAKYGFDCDTCGVITAIDEQSQDIALGVNKALEAKEKWGKMIERYLKNSAMLKMVFLLIDIRHEPSANDRMMYEWIIYNGYHPVVIATKLDKINRSQVQKHVKMIREGLGMEKDGIIIPFSAETKQGRDEIWNLIEGNM